MTRSRKPLVRPRLIERVAARIGSLLCCVGILLGYEIALADPAFPLKLDPNSRILKDQNNVPFLINGDTPWSLMVGPDPSDVILYLDNRREKGINAIIVNLIEHQDNGPENWEGERPFLTIGDYSTPNDRYFDHAEFVISEAAKRGILVMMTPSYVGSAGSSGWIAEMDANGATKMRDYGTYVGNRFNKFTNILWLHGGDSAPGSALEEIDALADGIRAVDNIERIHSYHCNRGKSAIDCYDRPWLELNSTYSMCPDTARRTYRDYSLDPIRPFFYIEGAYEGISASPLCIRGQAYWSILGGSTGHFFGNRPLYLFGNNWQDAMDSPGSQSLIHVGRLFASRPWDRLVPDHDHLVVTSGYGSREDDTFVAVAQTTDQTTMIAFLPTQKAVTVDLSTMDGAESTAWWYDPVDGQTSKIGDFSNTGSESFTPPASGDWILVVDSAYLGLPAPGSTVNDPPPPPDPPTDKEPPVEFVVQ